MKKFIALLLALVTALSLVACGSKDNGGSTDGDTVKIGIFEPTSGQNGAGGTHNVAGAHLGGDGGGQSLEGTHAVLMFSSSLPTMLPSSPRLPPRPRP